MWAINVNLKSEAPKADNFVVDIGVVVVIDVVVVVVVLLVVIFTFYLQGVPKKRIIRNLS